MRTIIFYYLYPLQLSPIIPLFFGVVNYRKLTTPVRIFFWQLVFSLETLIGMIIAGILHTNNIWLLNLSMPVNAVLLLWMFSLWQESAFKKNIVRGICILFLCIWLIEVALGERFFDHTIISRPLEGAIFALAACYTIFKVNRDLEAPIIDMPQFWICFGLLVYFGGMLIINLLSNTLLKSYTEILKQVYLIQPALSLISNLLFIGGFRCQSKNKTSSGLSSSALVSS